MTKSGRMDFSTRPGLEVWKEFGCYLLPVLAFSTSFGFGVWVKLNMALIGFAMVSYEPWPMRWLLSQLS